MVTASAAEPIGGDLEVELVTYDQSRDNVSLANSQLTGDLV
jgi:hypothetical protein